MKLKRLFKNISLIILLLNVRWYVCVAVAHADTPQRAVLTVKTFPTHSRLSVPISEEVSFQWNETREGFILLIKNMTTGELEPALLPDAGEEIKDPRIRSIRLLNTPQGVKMIGTWRYPAGKFAMANPAMEQFRYFSRNPQGLMIDFWHKKGPTVIESRAREERQRQLVIQHRQKKELERRIERRIAQEQSMRADPLRYCRQSLTDEQDVFTEFKPFREKFDFKKWVDLTTPDSGFVYFTPFGTTQEAQYVRLALQLYKKGNFALAIRTTEFLAAEYPRSKFLTEMLFLKANALIRLSQEAKGEKILSDLVADFPLLPLAQNASLYMGIRTLEQGSPIVALEIFSSLARRFPTHADHWLFRMGAAEAQFLIRQTERAQSEYQWVMDNGPTQEIRALAATRIADLYLDRFQHKRALAFYFQAVTKFKDIVSRLPGMQLNRAEALYQLGQWDVAKEAFELFLKNYAGHPEGWRATFRLSEIYGRKGGEENMKAMYTYLSDTVNHYPYSPGATLSRIRMIPCGNNGSMSAEVAIRFFEGDAQEFNEKDVVNMERYPEMRTMGYIRTLVSFGMEEKASEVAFKYAVAGGKYSNNPVFQNMLVDVSRRTILTYLQKGRKLDAILFYREKFSKINAEYIGDPSFLLQLSRAASELGLGTVAQQIADNFQKVSVTRLPAEEGSGPDKSEKSEKAFTQAKALWVSQGLKQAQQIRSLLVQVEPASSYAYEQEVILGLMDEKEGKLSTALAHALKATFLTHPNSEDELRTRFWAAGLQIRAGDTRIAVQMLQEIENKSFAATQEKTEKAGKKPEQKLDQKTEQKTAGTTLSQASLLGLPAAPTREEVLIQQAELLTAQKRWAEAARAYGSAAEAGLGGNRVLVEYARNIRKSTGDPQLLAKARIALEKAAQSKTEDFWKRLAIESLDSQKNTKEGVK